MQNREEEQQQEEPVVAIGYVVEEDSEKTIDTATMPTTKDSNVVGPDSLTEQLIKQTIESYKSEITMLKDLTVKLGVQIGEQTAKISRLKAKNAVKDEELEQKMAEFEAHKNYQNRPAAYISFKVLAFIVLMLASVYGLHNHHLLKEPTGDTIELEAFSEVKEEVLLSGAAREETIRIQNLRHEINAERQNVKESLKEEQNDALLEARIEIARLKTQLQESSEEKSQIKSDSLRKDKSVADLDSEVSSLTSLLEKSKQEKEFAMVKIRTQRQTIADLAKMTKKIPKDLLTLPAQLTIDDIEFKVVHGKDFNKLKDLNFFKKIIIDACASSKNIKNEARDKIKAALEKKTGQKVSVVTFDDHSDNNTEFVYLYHSIKFKVKGVIFFFFIK